jgi:hypothetical protein
MFFCKICQEWELDNNHSQHHEKKYAVFGDGDVIDVCRTPCHDALEELIRIKENEILKQHPEIYEEALREIVGNHRAIKKYYGLIMKRRAAKDRQYPRKKRRKK